MKNKNIFLLLLLASLWGPSFLFIKIAVADITPITLVAIRLSLAAVMLTGILLISGGKFPKGIAFWKKFIIMGFFANALPFTLFSFGEQFADSGSASILNGTTPIFTVIFAHFFIAEERLSFTRVGGVALGFLGILLIFFPDIQRLAAGLGVSGEGVATGLVAFIGASVCYGVAITYGRAKLRGLPPLVGPAAQLICSTAMTIPFAFLLERPLQLEISPGALTAAAVLGIFGTGFAYLVYYRLVDSASATFLSFVTYLLPPIGVILGVVFLNEQPGWYSLAGLLTIILGVMIVNGSATNLWAKMSRPAQVRVK